MGDLNVQGQSATPAELRRFLKVLWHFDRRAVAFLLTTNILAALTAGAGFVLLLPLLSLAGVMGAGGDGWSATFEAMLGTVGLHLNLATALILFVVLVGLQTWLTLLRDRQSQALQLRFGDHLRLTLYHAMAAARWRWLTRRHSADLLGVLTNDIQRVGSGTFHLLQLLTTALLTTVYLGVALLISPFVTALALVTGALLWLVLRRGDTVAKHSGALLSQATRGMFTLAQEFLAAMKLTKIHGEEGENVALFEGITSRLRGHQLRFNHVRTRVMATYKIGGALVLAGLTWVALDVLHLPTASLLVLIALFAKLLPSLSQVQTGIQQLWHMLPAFTTWRLLVAEGEEHADPTRHVPGGEAPALLRAIALEAVAYRHPTSDFVVNAAELHIPARATTAIVGPSGSGKTTLLDLICGLIPPDHGALRLDDLPLEQALTQGWRSKIAYVPQETTILDGTARENLLWGNRASEEEIADALRHAAAEFLLALPQGLDTQVGERGVRLSGGEKQRLALARALLRRPELLILDEATSALDRDNERAILEAVRGLHGQMTILIVTHRHEWLDGLIDGRAEVAAGVVGGWSPA